MKLRPDFFIGMILSHSAMQAQTRLDHNVIVGDIRFLLACLRGEKAPAELTTPAMFARLLEHHRVALQLCPASLDDPNMAAQLMDKRRNAALYAIELVASLNQTTIQLRSIGIEPIWFKGPALAGILYGQPLLRLSRDLDFWVEAENIAPALTCLEAAGWRRLETAPLKHLQRTAHAITLRHPERRGLLELHWRFATPDRILPLDQLAPRQHARSIAFGNQTITTLSLEATLPYLAHHGTGHFWNRLFWLVDIRAAASAAVDWDKTLTIARSIGAQRRLALAFLAAERLLDAPLPSAIQRMIMPAWRLEKRLALLRKAFAAPPEIDTTMMYRVGLWHYLDWELGLQDDWSGRLALISQRMKVTGKDEQFFKDKAWLGAFLPLLRLARIGARALRYGGRDRS